jgi:hypothetical protein
MVAEAVVTKMMMAGDVRVEAGGGCTLQRMQRHMWTVGVVDRLFR